MKKGIIRITFGILLILVQLISIVGNLYSETYISLIRIKGYDVFFVIGYLIPGICGVILLLFGIRTYLTKEKSVCILHSNEANKNIEVDCQEETPIYHPPAQMFEYDKMLYSTEMPSVETETTKPIVKNEIEKEESYMFCQYCGKQINESADVCIGCGKLLNQEKRTKYKAQSTTQSKLFMTLSVIVLVFCSIFFVIGMTSFFIGVDNGLFEAYYSQNFFLNTQRYSPDTFWITTQTYFFVTLFVSLIFELCSAILSLILLVFNDKKVINIVSFGISMGLLIFVGIIAFFAGV